MPDNPSEEKNAFPGAPADLGEPLVSTLDDPGFAELVRIFVDELPVKIQTLENYLRVEDFRQLANLVHQLKGSAGGYGFRPITESAARLEKTAKEASDLKMLDAQMKELVDLCRRATPAQHP